MTQKRALVYAVIASLLALLVYVQFRTWRNFDWAVFRAQTDQVFRPHGLLHILGGVGCTYLAYLLRSFRWRIFLRPVKKTTSGRLLTPTIIGFTGLALLGRPGEMIRPYLIARKEGLSFSSQLAVWTVERIFDIGAFAVLLITSIFFAPSVRHLNYSFRRTHLRAGTQDCCPIARISRRTKHHPRHQRAGAVDCGVAGALVLGRTGISTDYRGVRH